METEKSNLCCGCLAGDRKMHLIQNLKEQCFLQIIKEITITLPSALSLWLCWECEAYITRFTKFKLQVKHSYQILREFSKQAEFTTNHQKFSVNRVVDITLSPTTDESESTNTAIKTEKEEHLATTMQIKYETDYSEDDDKLLIDICNDSKIKKTKLKRRRKVKVKKEHSIFREVELSEQQIVDERNDLATKDDFVNAMFRCQMCIMSFPNEDDMKEHVWKKHDLHASKHKCSICQCAFSTEVAFNYHQKRHTKRYECLLCNVRCVNKVAVRNHYSTHFHSSTYDFGQKANKNTEARNENHNGAISEEKFPCEYCPKVFGWKTSLRKHVETHRIEAGQKRRPYCEPCRLSFKTTSNLQKHVKTSSKHQIQLKLRKLKESNPQPDTMNDAQIADIKTIVNRQRELYPCEQCDKKFQWRGNLLRHLHSHAARANGELVCAPCNRTFSSIATYKQHMKISKKHATENDFKYMCSDCGKRFANKTKLREHVDWEHLKNYVHTCSDCHKVFKSHTSLYLHRQVVHKRVSAEHLCENCGKAFPNQTKLRSHIIALHTREAPYKCGACGARFSWHSCLSRHLRRVHKHK